MNEVLKAFCVALLQEKGVGNNTLLNIIREHSASDLFEGNFEPEKFEKIKKQFLSAKKSLKSFEEMLAKSPSKSLAIWEEEYPKLLKYIPDAPVLLYYVGDLEAIKSGKTLTVVGTRMPSSYGVKVTSTIVKRLAEVGVKIVSGMAFGIDKQAHDAALAANDGKTIAVLPASPNIPTPASNYPIYRRILDNGGLILSEFGAQQPIIPGLFPRRNRILAGISDATLVVEAKKKSGALITANLAFDYDRMVFAVPGNITSEKSSGTNHIIKYNKAKLIESAEDIFEELGIKQRSVEYSFDISTLSEIELKIFDLLKDNELLAEEISNILKLNLQNIVAACSMLELKNVIIKTESGRYSIKFI